MDPYQGPISIVVLWQSQPLRKSLALSAQLGWPKAAYLHIPFCRQRCHYCDFATGLGTRELIETYVQVLCQEIGGAYRYRHLAGDPQPLTSIFSAAALPPC
jgi:coproporphyrinogen III oxidase-like Fe-S oxidoreductase